MVFRRVVPTGSRGLSTTSSRQYQYTYREAIRIAGPHLKKTTSRTHLNNSKHTETARQPLPLALSPQQFTLDKTIFPLVDNLELATPKKLEEVVTAIDESDLPEIKNEAGLIEEAGPYFLKVVQYLASDLLKGLGFEKKLRFETERSQSASVPDKVIYYGETPVVIFDYKGPNCIMEKELTICSAGSLSDAQARLEGAMIGTESDNVGTLLEMPGVTLDTIRLIQQGVKYTRNFKASTVLFYDYDSLLALDVPPALIRREPDVLLETTLWKETQKSTEEEPVYTENNHVAALLYYIVREVRKVEEGGGGA